MMEEGHFVILNMFIVILLACTIAPHPSRVDLRMMKL